DVAAMPQHTDSPIERYHTASSQNAECAIVRLPNIVQNLPLYDRIFPRQLFSAVSDEHAPALPCRPTAQHIEVETSNYWAVEILGRGYILPPACQNGLSKVSR